MRPEPASGKARTVRIGIDATLACSSRPTGVEYFARSVLSELVAVETPSVEWHVYLPPRADPGCALPSHVQRHVCPDVNTLVKQPWLMLRTRLDRLHVLFSFSHRLPAGSCGRIVSTIYDTAFDEYPECYPQGDAELAHREVEQTCRRSRRLVVPSAATAQNLTRIYGYPGERIDVVQAGCRPQFRTGEAGSLPARVAAAGIVSPFFLTVGRMDRRKNLERVIDAYREVVRAGVPCGGLVIAGPDDSGSEAVEQRLVATKVPGERIVRTGYLGEPELVSLYRSAAALVYPSLSEGFGLPVLEAMACGTPTITSNVSALPEVAGNAALLVTPTSVSEIAEAMRSVLSSDDLRRRLRADGLQRAAEFTWRSTADRVCQALLSAANGVRTTEQCLKSV